MKVFIILQIFITLNYRAVNSQSCKIIEAFLSPGFYNVAQQQSSGFCNEWVIGPFLSMKQFFIQFPQVNLNCALGDVLTITNEDRTQILFNYCSPVAKQIPNALVSESKYVFMTLTTKTSNYLSINFYYYLMDVTAAIPVTPQIITTPSFSTCGSPAIKPLEQIRIVGGFEALANSWPWQVLISDGSSMCGASIIENSWLVTAAHCIEGVNMKTFKAYFGLHSINKITDSTTIIRNISRTFPHESYRGIVTSWEHDIAMLKLQSPITYNSLMSPVCLPTQSVNLAVLGTVPYVTGWGRTSGYGATSDVLKQASITVQPLSKCGATSDFQLCAGGSSPISDSCGGDSGGPSVLKSNNLFYLTGIVSWGSADCSGDGVYTKVSSYVNWIQNIIKLN